MELKDSKMVLQLPDIHLHWLLLLTADEVTVEERSEERRVGKEC